MPVKVDEVVEDGKGLDQAMGNHKDVILAKGEGQKKRDKLEAAVNDLVRKNTAQVNAQNALEQRTKDQDEVMRAALENISQVQNAAKSAFEGDKIKQKEFKIGTSKPTAVKGMITFLDYFTGIVQKYSDILLANGMTQSDIDEVSAVYAKLVTADAIQENAKKLRNAATKTRDAALASLKRTIGATRSYAKVVFKNDKAALEEFKSISRARGRSRTKPPGSSTGQPQG